MIRIYPAEEPNTVPLVAVTYTTNLGIPPVVRLASEPLVTADSLALTSVGLKETTNTPVGFTPKRAIGFPAWPILTDPGNAHHALNLVKDVEWARRKAKTEAGKVKKRIDELVTTLQSSAPHFLPTFLEEIARIFAIAGNGAFGKQYFGKAREMERVHQIPIDFDRHGQAFREFAQLGVITAKTLTQESHDAADRMAPKEAYQYFFNLLVEQATAGTGLYANALKDVQALGEKAGIDQKTVAIELIAACVPTRGFMRSADSLFSKMRKLLPEVVEAHPELDEVLYSTIHEFWQIDDFVNLLQRVKLWEPLRSNPTKFAAWLEETANKAWTMDTSGKKASCYAFFLPTHRDLLAAIEENKAALAGMTLNIESRRTHPDYLDLFEEIGVGWKLTKRERGDKQFTWIEWLWNHHRDLKYLLGKDTYRDGLITDLDPEALSEHLDALLKHETTTKVVGLTLETYRELRSGVDGSKQQWEILEDKRKHLHDPRLLELFPDVVAEILHIDPAAELAERLRRGTVVEYAWGEFERTAPSFLEKYSRVTTTYPWVCLQEDGQLHIFNGTEHKKYRLNIDYVDKVIPTADDVFVVYRTYSPSANNWMWLSEGKGRTCASSCFGTPNEEYVTVIDGTLYVGPTSITNHEMSAAPIGYQVGFGPIYAVADEDDRSVTVLPDGKKISAADFNKHFAAGTLLGLDIPQAAKVAATHNAVMGFDYSFSVQVTDTTAASPFGVAEKKLYSISLCTKDAGCFTVSPLGVFHSPSAGEFFAVQKPGGHAWYLRKGHYIGRGHYLYDAATDTEIAPALTNTGELHPLNRLSSAAFHQLRVRNEKVSAKMRACSTAQAAELMSNPVSIIDFAENDETLAAAIAGIIVDISEITGATLKIPALEQVPEPLAHLYATVQPDQRAEPTIPLPPLPIPHTHDEDFAQQVHDLACLLGTPLEQGDVEVGWQANYVLHTIGKEKLWLAWLASPGIGLDNVRSYHPFLTWCAEHGILGTWRLAQRADASYEPHWHNQWKNKIFVFGQDTKYLWNPAYSETGKKTRGANSFWDELFMPKEEFMHELDAILAWHEQRHTADTEAEPRWNNTSINEAAEKAASVSALPPVLWACMFAGANKPQLEIDFHEEKVTFPRTFGITQSHINTFRESGRDLFGYRRDLLHALSWHEDFLVEGPSVEKIRSTWEQLWGKPWVQVSDEMWQALPDKLRRRINATFYGEEFNDGRSRKSESAWLFPLYLHLTHLVEPGTGTAQALAGRIEQAASYHIENTNIALGADYDSPGVESYSLYLHVLRLVSEGYLDTLLAYLKTGSPIEGTKQDPLASAPGVVADAARTLGLSTDAARYFLQLLALTRPTDVDVKKWNGWGKKHLDQAHQELLDKELVITAKRTGTGRSIFLPGGWLDKSDTGPAMEMWKAPHYLLWKDAKCRPIVETCPPLVPYPELFKEVWERYKTGDVPGYEELTTSRYRTKR